MATGEVQPDEAGAQPLPAGAPKGRRAFSSLKRELTDDELSPPGARKLLLDSLGQAQEENEDLRSFREKYYDADKRLGILQQKLKTTIAFEVLSIGAIAVGGASLGFARSIWGSPGGLTFVRHWQL